MSRTYTPPDRPGQGWIHPDQRTKEQKALDEQYRSEVITPFASLPLRSKPINVGDRYPLWKFFEALPEKKAPYVNQTTGSCVGAGGYNALMTLMMVEIVSFKEPEKWNLMWWPFTYEVSRFLGGFRRKGEGSFGSSWYKAVREFGMPRADYPGLPKYEYRNGWLYLKRSIEYDWSFNPKFRDEWDEEGAEHPIEGGNEIKTIDELDAALTNGRPCTIASGTWGTRSSEEVDGWRIAKWNDKWGHQQYIDEVCRPTRNTGKLYRIGNNWGPNAHPRPTKGEPAGGYYVREKHMAKILSDRYAECFSISSFRGIPSDIDIWDIAMSILIDDIFNKSQDNGDPNNETHHISEHGDVVRNGDPDPVSVLRRVRHLAKSTTVS